jgi:hypothetical protein
MAIVAKCVAHPQLRPLALTEPSQVEGDTPWIMAIMAKCLARPLALTDLFQVDLSSREQ